MTCDSFSGSGEVHYVVSHHTHINIIASHRIASHRIHVAALVITAMAVR